MQGGAGMGGRHGGRQKLQVPQRSRQQGVGRRGGDQVACLPSRLPAFPTVTVREDEFKITFQ